MSQQAAASRGETSLLKSKYYQGALKVNFVELNRLHKISKRLSVESNR